MKVGYFVVPHEATQTVGYAIEADGHKFVIMTDIGRMTDEAVEFARQADTVVVESNYDMDMLMRGPYTYELKMRIVQGCGHLSNDECASAIKRFWHPGLRNIFLCHLSENNNTHDLAYECAAEALEEIGVPKGSVSLRCLPRRYPSQLFTL
jgi:phosphoribosyl 1,2-cyclic phosphodiesterase